MPVGKNIRILTSSADVIHSFFIPSLGVQRYAIPGRTIETWVGVKARHVLRRVQPDLRHQPQPHADLGSCRAATGIRCLGGAAEEGGRGS